MKRKNQRDLGVNFSSDELDRIKRAADIGDQSISEFIVQAAFDKAVRTIFTDKVAFISDEAYQVACRTVLDLHAKDRG